jgi:hypothetical protein
MESVFAGVRLRTEVAKRARKRENALYLVFKVVQQFGRNRCALKGGPTLMRQVAEDSKDGEPQDSDQETVVIVRLIMSTQRKESPHLLPRLERGLTARLH